MKPIVSHKSIYDTAGRAWILAVEIEGEEAPRRFTLAGAADAEILIRSFEESSYATFDPDSGEIAFVYEYVEYDEDDDEDDDEDEDDEEDQEDEEGAPRPGPSR